MSVMFPMWLCDPQVDVRMEEEDVSYKYVFRTYCGFEWQDPTHIDFNKNQKIGSKKRI